MKSKTAKRLLSETPQEIKDKARDYADEIVNMKSKTVEELAEEFSEKYSIYPIAKDDAYFGFVHGFAARKEIEQKILKDLKNKYKSWLSSEQVHKLGKTANYEREVSYKAYIEIIEEIQNKL